MFPQYKGKKLPFCEKRIQGDSRITHYPVNYSDSLTANLKLSSLPFFGLKEYEGFILFKVKIS
jgi:hypothetical protein